MGIMKEFWRRKKKQEEELAEEQEQEQNAQDNEQEQNGDNDTYSENPENGEQNPENQSEDTYIDDDELEADDTISKKKEVSKNMIILGSLAVVGAGLLFGTKMILGGKKKDASQDAQNQVTTADDKPIEIGDGNNETGDLMSESEQNDANGSSDTSSDTSDTSSDGGVSEDEFRKSLEDSDNSMSAGSEWNDVDTSPATVSGGSSGSSGSRSSKGSKSSGESDFSDAGGADVSEAGTKMSPEEIKAAQKAEKKKQRDERLKEVRAGGMSFMSNQSQDTGKGNGQGQNIAVTNGRVDPNQVPAGTYQVASDGSVQPVSGGSAGAGSGIQTAQAAPGEAQGQPSQNQQKNMNPFTQTDPAITGRGAQGYGSVNYNSGSVIAQQSRYTLSAGQIIPTTLLSGIKTITSDMAIAVVSSDVYDTRTGRHLLIPRGSKILGEYTPYMDGANYRVITIWNRIIFPNGTSINLAQFKGVDLQGYGGMKAQVNTHFWKKLANVVMSTITAVGYNFADRLTIEHGKVKLTKYVTRDSNGNTDTDSPQTLGDVIEKIQSEAENKNSQIQTLLTVKQGTRFNVRVNSDIVLDSPYKPDIK